MNCGHRARNSRFIIGLSYGGIAQGVGQALLEHSHYDPRTGQLLAASFMDYAMPRVDTFPELKTAVSEVSSPSNRLGVRSIEMPASPERVWRAIQGARAGAAG